MGPAQRPATSRARQGGAAGGGLQLAPPYLPGPGRVAPVVTENKEVALGGGAWVSWSRFQGWKVLLLERSVVGSSSSGYFC